MFKFYSPEFCRALTTTFHIPKAENATVSSVNASASEVTYTYKPNSLPLANVAKYKYVKNYGVDIENHMNREIIKVSNLEKGTYTITMNGAEIGSYSAKELAEGVNVAEIANNPNQQVAVTLDAAVTKKFTNEKSQEFTTFTNSSGNTSEYKLFWNFFERR